PILDILTNGTRKMTEGELLQLTLGGQAEINDEQYLEVLKRKTAYLFSASCEIGSILGSAADQQQAALRDYGLNLGTAFQLIDDVLDFTSNEDVLGKASGADLLGGKVTLPLIYLMQSEPSFMEAIRSVLRDGEYSRISKADLFAALSESGSIERARSLAYEYAQAARTALDCLPESHYREALKALPSYVLDRDH